MHRAQLLCLESRRAKLPMATGSAGRKCFFGPFYPTKRHDDIIMIQKHRPGQRLKLWMNALIDTQFDNQ
eukprot:scaffold597958_cov19-Prasinocladus_malaysianus.AAC.1